MPEYRVALKFRGKISYDIDYLEDKYLGYWEIIGEEKVGGRWITDNYLDDWEASKKPGKKVCVSHWWIIDKDIGEIRTKLIYIPVILATAMIGPPEGKNLKTFSKIHYYLSEEPFKWNWSSEDQRVYEELKNKVKPKVKRILEIETKSFHVFWPVTVLELNEVKEEMEKIKNGLFSPKDEVDRRIVLVCGHYWGLDKPSDEKSIE